MKEKYNVIFLTGGPSEEHEISIKSFKTFYKSLSNADFLNLHAYLCSEKLKWYEMESFDPLIWEKKEIPFVKLLEFIQNLQNPIVVPIIHGTLGEDGKIASVMEMLNIPYLFSSYSSANVTLNKYYAESILRNFDLDLPFSCLIRKDENYLSKLKFYLSQYSKLVLLPPDEGSSINVIISDNMDEIEDFLNDYFQNKKYVLVKEYIKGIEFTMGVFEDPYTGNPIALPPIKIVPKYASFFDFNSKYTPGFTIETFDTGLSKELISKFKMINEKIFRILSLKTIARSDFIFEPDSEKFYFLETNTIPGMTETSLIPQSIKKAGYSLPEFLLKLLATAFCNEDERKRFLSSIE